MSDRVPVLAPDLGTADAVRLSGWLVEVGETVRAGDRIVELLLPGVTYDVPCPATGRLVETALPTGAGVRAGDVLGYVEPDEDV